MSAAHCPGSYLNRRNRRDGTIIQDGIFEGTANAAIIWRDLAGLGGGRGRSGENVIRRGREHVAPRLERRRPGRLDKLTPIVYDGAPPAGAALHEAGAHRPQLQTTALVNEAYMRLVDYKRMRWQNRAHFFAVSAQLMRRILVDHARRHNLKRGGGVQHVSLEETAMIGGDQDEDLVALDDAMKALAPLDPRKAQVVEMRFFGGLSVEETAEVLKVSPVTVMRDWSTARAWLYREMSGGARDGC